MNTSTQTSQNRYITSYVLFVLNIFLRETLHSDPQKITFQALFTYLYHCGNQFLTLSYDFLRLQLVRLDKRLKEADLKELPSDRLIKDRLSSLFDHHSLIGISFFQTKFQKKGPPLLRLIPHIDIILDRSFARPDFSSSPYKILEEEACKYAQELFATATPLSKDDIQEKKRKNTDDYMESLILKLSSSPSDSQEYQDTVSSLVKLDSNFFLAINQSQNSIERNQKRRNRISEAFRLDSVARHSLSPYRPSVPKPSKKRNTGGGSSSSIPVQNPSNFSPVSSVSETVVRSENSPENLSKKKPKIEPENTQKMETVSEAPPYGRPYSESVRVFLQDTEKNKVIKLENDQKSDMQHNSGNPVLEKNDQKTLENDPKNDAEMMVEIFEKMGVNHFLINLYKPTGYDQAGKEIKKGKKPEKLTPHELKKRLPDLEKNNGKGLNLGIHPVLPKDSKVKLILLDDLTQEFYDKLKKYGFWGQRTSEKSFHLWVAIEGAIEKQFQSIKTRLKAKYGGDPSASYSKICGSLNWKLKYGDKPPRIKKMAVDGESRVTNEAELVADGIIEKEEEKASTPPPCVSKRKSGLGEGKKWPDYRISLAGAPLKEDGTPDRSVADFRWCCYAIWKLGWKDENEIARKLIEVSERATEGGWKYSIYTVQKAFKKNVN